MVVRDKVALVTGSAVGVGRAVALLLAGRGAKVAVNFSQSEAEALTTMELCKKAGSEAVAIRADVGRDDEVRRLVAAAVDAFGGLDILINNAAVTYFVAHEDLEGMTEAMWDRIHRTNVLGPFFCTRAAVPHMHSAGAGAIVNVASMAGITAAGSSIAYCASKAAVINMTMSLARALAPMIRVNAVAPGPIDTRWLHDGIGEEGYRELDERVRTTSPLRRISTAEDIAEAILWLVEGAANTTGEVIKVDAGGHLGPATVRRPR